MSLRYGFLYYSLGPPGRKRTGKWPYILLAIVGFMASFVLASPLWAEPSPVVDYLMHEPVSMLDRGLEKIEEDLYRNRGVLTKNDGDLFDPEPIIRVDYAWEENRIQIFLKLTLTGNIKKTSQRMTAIQQHVEFVTAYLRGGLTMRPYDAFFRHKGYRSKESPENLVDKLVEITDIHIMVRDHQQNILSRCRAPLSGKDIVWSNMGGS